MGCNRFPKKRVTLLRSIALKGIVGGHFVHGTVKGLDTSRREGEGDIPDAEFDDFHSRLCGLKSRHTLGNFAEKVRRL